MKLISDVEKFADYGSNYANPARTRRGGRDNEPSRILRHEQRFHVVDNDESLLRNSDRRAFR